MISCIIVDDEQHAIEVLKLHIGQLSNIQILGSFTNPIEALEFLGEHAVDLVFLDVHMPSLSGINFIKLNAKPKYILTTAYSDYALAGYELNIVDYLMKPISFERFLKALQKLPDSGNTAEKDAGYDDDFLFIKTEARGKLLKINIDDIDYVEGLKNYVGIYHNGQKTLALLNMKDLEDRLPYDRFMRVHKSFIVSLKKIQGIDGNIIRLKNINAEILLGDTYKEIFMKKIQPYILSR